MADSSYTQSRLCSSRGEWRGNQTGQYRVRHYESRGVPNRSECGWLGASGLQLRFHDDRWRVAASTVGVTTVNGKCMMPGSRPQLREAWASRSCLIVARADWPSTPLAELHS